MKPTGKLISRFWSQCQIFSSILEEAMLTSAIDPTTGMMDMDIIQTGRSAKARDMDEQKRSELRQLIASNSKNNIRYIELFTSFRDQRAEVFETL